MKKQIKTVDEIFAMLASYQEETLVYGYTKSGSQEWANIEAIQAMLDAEDDADKSDALYAAHRALYKEYKANAHAYAQEVLSSDGFKAYIEKNGWAES